MTSIRRLERIRGLLELKLPPKLEERKLDNFDSYKVGHVLPVDQNSCNIVTTSWEISMEHETYEVGLIFQLYSGEYNPYLYESVLIPSIEEILEPEEIEMTILSNRLSEVTPIQEENCVVIEITLTYSTPIDTSKYLEESEEEDDSV